MKTVKASQTGRELAAVEALTPWVAGYWFGFTYLPPALLVGREACLT